MLKYLAMFLAFLIAAVPAEADDGMETFEVQPGFRVELVAAEPLLRDPIAMAFDEQGRLFVVEYPEYNQTDAAGNGRPRGSVRMLEDTDGDGQFDGSTIYVSELDSPSAVACYDGGVFVAAAPNLLFCKDTDGDGRADQRKVVFTGFVRSANRTDPSLNSIRWGLDNRFHACTSYSGSDIRSVVEKDLAPRSIRNRGFLFDPRTLRFDLSSGGGQHGLAIDDWGREFLCSNSSPVRMLMYDDRYLARNPWLQAPPPAVEISAGGKHTELFRISPDEQWRIERTRLRSEGEFRGSNEGGKPSGFFTSATGVTSYRGDAWPDRYRGSVFVGEPANNLVFRAKLEPNGVGFVARRADPKAEFLASTDTAFRPVQFANAPDGNLYVIDMHRELIEGRMFLPAEVLAKVNAAGGNDRGRIYRIVPDESSSATRKRNTAKSRADRRMPADATTIQLVGMLEHRNGWHRDTASRLLYQRQDKSAVGALRKLASESRFPLARMTAMYSLDGLGELDDKTVVRMLDDRVAQVRVHALRLAEERLASSAALQKKVVELVDDEDLLVRYQLTFSLGAFPLPSEDASRRGRFGVSHLQSRNAALARLVARDGHDQWVRLAALSSLHEGAGDLFDRLAADKDFRGMRHGRQFLVALSRQVGSANRGSEMAAVINSLDQWPAEERSLSEAVVLALLAQQKADARHRLLAMGGGRIKETLDRLLQHAKVEALDEKLDVDERIKAIRRLGLFQFGETQSVFALLLKPRQTGSVQSAAMETVERFEDAGIADLLLTRWPGLTPALRASATETLLSRTHWSMAFLDAVEQGGVGRGDLSPSRLELLRKHPNKEIAERVGQLFGDAALPRRRHEIYRQYQPALQMSGDIDRGKSVFKQACSACHQLDEVGTASVGADLKAVGDRDKSAVLLNILDPNREVKPQYLSYSLATDDGRVFAGMIAEESVNSITVRRVNGTEVTVLRNEIEQLRSSGQSFMPEGLEEQINQEQMADLLAFLMSQRKPTSQSSK